MKKTVVVTIGRNVGNTPMPDKEWHMFKRRMKNVCSTYATVVQSTDSHPAFNQQGLWDGVIVEDSASYVVLFYLSKTDLAAFREHVRFTGKYFHQEAVGFIVAGGHEYFA